MKTLNTILLSLSAVAVLGTSGLYAQTAVANIPFDFTAQTVTLPAGEYMLKPVSGTSGVIQFINHDTRKSVFVSSTNAAPSYGRKDTGTGKLIFHRYGDQYFFAEVQTENGVRRVVSPSKVERELTASAPATQLASVAIPLAGQ